MPTWTGNVRDLTGSPIPANRVPLLRFRLSGPTSTPAGLLTTFVREVTPGADGSFSVDLEDVSAARPRVWVILEVAWFDAVTTADGLRRLVAVDLMPWRIYPGPFGGNLSDVIDSPPAAGDVWVGEAPPTDQIGRAHV